MRAADASPREAGFTLIEVIVALAVMALLLGALFQSFGGGLDRLSRADWEQRASLIARSQLDEALRLPLDEAEDRGREGDFVWRRNVTEVPFAALGLDEVSGWQAYRLEVQVTWAERQALTLSSLRVEAE